MTKCRPTTYDFCLFPARSDV